MWMFRVAGLLCLPVALYLVVRTASRAGLITICVLSLYIFFRVKPMQKVFMAVAAVAAVAGLASVIPASSLERYRTLISDDVKYSAAGASAEESARGRKELLMDSLVLTMAHPVFGVGAGNFAPAASNRREKLGERAMWQVSHNTYTQVSSETGVPGLIIFLTAIMYCVRSTFRIYKKFRSFKDSDSATITDMAGALRLSWITFILLAAFDSLAYSLFVPVLMGLTELMIACARHVSLPPDQRTATLLRRPA
jgi:O-antigen ligase